MAIVHFPKSLYSLNCSGTFGYNSGCGRARLGYSRCGADSVLGGIYQRKVYGKGVTFLPSKRGNRWGISLMKYYRPTNPRTIKQQTWRGVFAGAILAWRGLTIAERAIYSQKARTRGMSGYNLFISHWLQSRRA